MLVTMLETICVGDKFEMLMTDFLNRENTVTDIKLSPKSLSPGTVTMLLMIPYREDRLGPTSSENKPVRPCSKIFWSENNSQNFLLAEIAWDIFPYR